MALSLLKKPDEIDVRTDRQETRPLLKWKLAYGHIPVKRSINFVTVGEKPIDWRIALPAIALIVALSGLVSKVAVIDRLAALDAARSEVYAIQNEIRQRTEEYESFKDISVDYAHYTVSDMTAEERDRVSRVTVMEVVQQIILPVAPLDAWSLHENTLSIHVSSNTLTEITAMVEQLQASPVVSSCTILSESTTVSSKGNISTEETITAKVDIVFKTATQIQKEAEEAEQEAEAQAETVQAEQETKPSRSIPENGLYTTKEDVALYLRLYGHLPENFITKAQAEALGWDGGSLRGSAPGMSIGGDPFGNYEGRLPSGHTYYECDINTMGKDDRGAERLVFSDDGLIYYTGDHYETFTLLYGTP